MSEAGVVWTVIYGVRHLVIETPAGRWVACDLGGSPLEPGAPCTVCAEAMYALVETASADQ